MLGQDSAGEDRIRVIGPEIETCIGEIDGNSDGPACGKTHIPRPHQILGDTLAQEVCHSKTSARMTDHTFRGTHDLQRSNRRDSGTAPGRNRIATEHRRVKLCDRHDLAVIDGLGNL